MSVSFWWWSDVDAPDGHGAIPASADASNSIGPTRHAFSNFLEPIAAPGSYGPATTSEWSILRMPPSCTSVYEVRSTDTRPSAK